MTILTWNTTVTMSLPMWRLRGSCCLKHGKYFRKSCIYYGRVKDASRVGIFDCVIPGPSVTITATNCQHPTIAKFQLPMGVEYMEILANQGRASSGADSAWREYEVKISKHRTLAAGGNNPCVILCRVWHNKVSSLPLPDCATLGQDSLSFYLIV